jgi:hypothetical protein
MGDKLMGRVLRRPPNGWSRGQPKRQEIIDVIGAIAFLCGMAVAGNLFFAAGGELMQALLS